MKKTFQNHQVTQLEDNGSRVLIAPEKGARLLRWDADGKPVIFWPDAADWNHVEDVRGGNPILFPFIARHMVDGKIGFWKDEKGIVRALPMHGFAREMPFEIVSQTDNELRMRLESNDATRAMYPFDWRFEVVYSLRGSTLETRLETTNTGSATMPYYNGHHYYFALPHDERAQWSLTLPCERWASQDFESGDILFRPATSDETSLDDPELVDRMHVAPGDEITLRNDSKNRRLVIRLRGSTPDWFAVTTWTASDDADFYCIEPWLGLPNAIHHGHGLRHLVPGQSESAVCWIDASEW